MKWRQGLLLLIASGCWLGFRLWQTIRLYREIAYYRKMNSPMAGMLLEGRQSLVDALLTWLAIAGFVTGAAILIVEFHDRAKARTE